MSDNGPVAETRKDMSDNGPVAETGKEEIGSDFSSINHHTFLFAFY